VDPLSIIKKYFEPGTDAHDIFLEHGTAVAEKALSIAKGLCHLNPDLSFIREAAMLHDIGIVYVNAPGIGCHGSMPYICHGYLGRDLLEKEGYPLHALVAERHIGTGITTDDIIGRDLPLPVRDMQPLSLEERIICYADKFFSKMPGHLRDEKSFEQAIKDLEKFGQEKTAAFIEMQRRFSKIPFREKDLSPLQ